MFMQNCVNTGRRNMRTDRKKINGWSLGEGAGEVSVTTPEVLWMPISLLLSTLIQHLLSLDISCVWHKWGNPRPLVPTSSFSPEPRCTSCVVHVYNKMSWNWKNYLKLLHGHNIKRSTFHWHLCPSWPEKTETHRAQPYGQNDQGGTALCTAPCHHTLLGRGWRSCRFCVQAKCKSAITQAHSWQRFCSYPCGCCAGHGMPQSCAQLSPH